METLLLPFTPRFIALTVCAVATALLCGLVLSDHEWFEWVWLPLLGLAR
jgi:hypothetical protein